MIDDLRSQLKAVEEWGDLLRIPREVDPHGFEIPAISKKLEADKAVFFEKVKGYAMPVVVGLDNSHTRIARALETDDYGLTDRYLGHPQPPAGGSGQRRSGQRGKDHQEY